MLKRSFLSIIAVALAGYAMAQSNDQDSKPEKEDDVVRKIEVYGSAEREVTPDEIHFTITLKEYQGSDNKKVSIDKLERDLYDAVGKMGIDKEDFQVMDVAGYNYDWYRKGKKQERENFQATKQYNITFKDLNEINKLFEYLDPKSIQSTNISGYSHSDIDKINNDLKIEALKNARQKAASLLGGIDEKLGEVIEVQEIDNGYQPPVMYARSMAMAQSDADSQPQIDFKKMELKAQVRTVFRIL